jgi:hypothetical protein
MNNRRIAVMSVTPRCRHRSTGGAPSGGDGVAAARPGDLGDWIERAQVGAKPRTTDVWYPSRPGLARRQLLAGRIVIERLRWPASIVPFGIDPAWSSPDTNHRHGF